MSLKLQIVLCTVSITFLFSDVISTKRNVPANHETIFAAFHASNRTVRHSLHRWQQYSQREHEKSRDKRNARRSRSRRNCSVGLLWVEVDKLFSSRMLNVFLWLNLCC